MLNQSNGLRFDVYERVHLPDDVAAIEELEEIELTPHIQATDRGQQVLLRGNLLLTGLYAPQGEAGESQPLEHWIPVEITLPMSRVHRMEDITVEIDNFDVDLLSSRTLNITGVLSLGGLQVENTAVEPIWQEEPITAVHRAAAADTAEPAESEAVGADDARAGEASETSEEPEYKAPPAPEPESELRGAASGSEPPAAAEPIAPTAQRDLPAASAPQEAPHEDPAPSLREPADGRPDGPSTEAPPPASSRPKEAAQANSGPMAWTAFGERDERELPPTGGIPGLDPSAAPEDPPAETAQPLAEAVQAAEAAEPPNEWTTPAPAATPEDAPPQESEPQGMKIAFSGKRPESGQQEKEGVGIMTLLHSNRREQEARSTAQQAEAQAQAAQVEEEAAALPGGEEVEWKRLFLGREPENEFRTVRLCIVQREETLDAIATRYELNPREIALYNRLDDQTVNEGQILYIPRSG
ncbi:LysM peptidoglycan-binding domain-containing protein [Paenibacillus sp. IB182496]|uniref:LysM peptidoglycan-binding domain-containing protein n=1 Tax=Paenibacillus sabuli TaxID=2772509 RepID=A0A927BRW8_9BACL|nr:LysM peptidoglycan-binding domain-containing protein [Paenibacillus sabuli]MBD2844625.1 LysM peptidoglycan-binding domain-containing protein [Paenibacillus sabuli]